MVSGLAFATKIRSLESSGQHPHRGATTGGGSQTPYTNGLLGLSELLARRGEGSCEQLAGLQQIRQGFGEHAGLLERHA